MGISSGGAHPTAGLQGQTCSAVPREHPAQRWLQQRGVCEVLPFLQLKEPKEGPLGRQQASWGRRDNVSLQWEEAHGRVLGHVTRM